MKTWKQNTEKWKRSFWLLAFAAFCCYAELIGLGSPTFLKTVGPWHILASCHSNSTRFAYAFELHALLQVDPRICTSKGWNDMKRPSGKKLWEKNYMTSKPALNFNRIDVILSAIGWFLSAKQHDVKSLDSGDRHWPSCKKTIIKLPK